MVHTNFHTHTVYCDGKDTPEEMVLEAIARGFTALGFSGHSYFGPDWEVSMSLQDQQKYIRDITELKEKYKGQIAIFCGIEQDYYSEEPSFSYEYRIGSVHSIFKDGQQLRIDYNAEDSRHTVETVYGGDFDMFAEDYFAVVSQVMEKTKADIIGHIDLISKFSQTNGYGQSQRFLDAAEKAVDTLIKYGKPFEINTGAMSRGARTIPYPTPEILQMIKHKGGSILISSDCHNRNYLDYGFEDAVKLAYSCGFTDHIILTENGFVQVPL